MSFDTISQAKRITEFLLQMLDSDDSVEAQAVLCTGICKLLLAGIVTEPRVSSLKSIPNRSKLILNFV